MECQSRALVCPPEHSRMLLLLLLTFFLLKKLTARREHSSRGIIEMKTKNYSRSRQPGQSPIRVKCTDSALNRDARAADWIKPTVPGKSKSTRVPHSEQIAWSCRSVSRS